MRKPKQFFNIAGPCIPDKHYMLDPFRGINDELTDPKGGIPEFVRKIEAHVHNQGLTEKSWDEKVYMNEEIIGGKRVVAGC
ncbi:MAG: hypothetical protein LBU70_06465 [Chitinispirillales bacterium]|jgi:hypothetical protein|nr:hypothetical protein [Chitinispirillales bacterium]